MVHAFTLVLLALATAAYALVNAFGAWAVVRRKGWVAGLFLLAATVLTVAAAAFVSAIPFTRGLLAAGLALASLASLANARVVFGRVEGRYHLLRAALALAFYLLADWVLR